MPDTSEHPFEQLRHLAMTLRQTAQARGHRAVLVLSGGSEWCRSAAEVVNEPHAASPCWWLGRNPPTGYDGLDWERARTRLGMETGLLVIDTRDGFDAEGFGALVGTVRAGGLLLLLTPPFASWPQFADPQLERFALYPYRGEQLGGRFIERLVQVLQSAEGVVRVHEGDELPRGIEVAEGSGLSPRDGIYATPEQGEAVAAVQKVATGHHPHPLVVSADRGRGKSAALGIAAAQLLHQGVDRILVTAPRIDAAARVFEHAAALLPGCEQHRGELLWQGAQLRFVAPDELVRVPHEFRLLLVDEAAAIPTPLLERMLDAGTRIVFATTIHGYEGTGRGFSLRFHKVLNARTPGWRALHLSQPVRWAAGDPLERLSFRALLLDAEAADDDLVAGASTQNCSFEQLEVKRLASDEQMLSELFGLLVLAHYRTSPNDLRQLLDGPQQSLFVLQHAGHVVAAALVVQEGELPPALADEVYLGRRRVQGHLLPQSLANHAGFVEAAGMRAARIMRIVVHPALQGRGLGSLLLQQVRQSMQQQGCDYVGASFGATAELLAFWLRQGFLPVRVGLAREASSGSHSVMVMSPLSSRAGTLFPALRERLAETLPELLAEPLSGLECELVDALLASTPPLRREAISEQDRRDLQSFAFGLRGYELCMLSIRKLVLRALADPEALSRLDPPQQRLLQDKVIQRHGWPQVVRSLGYSGRKQALQAMRGALAQLVRHYYGGGAENQVSS